MDRTSESSHLEFLYNLKKEEDDLFNRLSVRIRNKETYKLINIRKSPFIKIDTYSYILTDYSILVVKVYSQFLNDFWFDKIKHLRNDVGKPKYSPKFYWSKFGKFFEHYVSQIFNKCFENFIGATLLMFDKLKVKTENGEIEVADVYLRNKNKVIIAQVKGGNIYDKEKYGGCIETLYKKNREAFFENFGVNQLIKSLSSMKDNIVKLDSQFLKEKQYEVYPCIIVNDKSFQTPLMPSILKTRFKELIKNFTFDKLIIKNLTVLHISDLEILENILNENPEQIWKLLEYTQLDDEFVPPFYNAIYRNFENLNLPRRIEEFYKSLILKYNPNCETE